MERTITLNQAPPSVAHGADNSALTLEKVKYLQQGGQFSDAATVIAGYDGTDKHDERSLVVVKILSMPERLVGELSYSINTRATTIAAGVYCCRVCLGKVLSLTADVNPVIDFNETSRNNLRTVPVSSLVLPVDFQTSGLSRELLVTRVPLPAVAPKQPRITYRMSQATMDGLEEARIAQLND